MDPRVTFLDRRDLGPKSLDSEALERFERGEISLRDALGFEDEVIDTLRERGLSFLEGGKIAKCLGVFELLVRLGDADAGVWLTLARCHDLSGQPRLAAPYFERALEMAQREGDEAFRTSALSWGAHLLSVEDHHHGR